MKEQDNKKKPQKVDADLAYEITAGFRDELEATKKQMHKNMITDLGGFLNWITIDLKGMWFDDEYLLWNIPDTDPDWRKEHGKELPGNQFRFTTEELAAIFINRAKETDTADTIRAHIKVSIRDIQVDDRYYSFLYEVWRNGSRIKADRYDGKHSRRDDKKEFENDLINGYAMQLVLERVDFQKP